MDSYKKKEADNHFSNGNYLDAMILYSDIVNDDETGETAHKLAICMEEGLGDEEGAAYWRKVAKSQGYKERSSGSVSSSEQKEADEIYKELMGYDNPQDAKDLFRKILPVYLSLAEKGDVTYEFRYANCLFFLDDYEEAFVWFEKAAEKDYVDAIFNLGFFYQMGYGVEADSVKAVKYYEKAASKGSSAAQFTYGYCLQNGEGINQNITEAVKWYKKSAEAGQASGQFSLGRCYIEGNGVKQDYAEAIKWFKKAAEQGQIGAGYYLGRCYHDGLGVKKDEKEAAKWYEKGALEGDIDAACALGLLLFTSDPPNYVEAARWLKIGAEADESGAQYLLGLLYQDGNGVRQDYDEAFKWFSKSAENGFDQGEYSLAICYIKGWGCEQDYGKGLDYLMSAAEKGNAKAQELMGEVISRSDQGDEGSEA